MSGYYREVLIFDPTNPGAGFEIGHLLVLDDDSSIQISGVETGTAPTAYLNDGAGFTFQGPMKDHEVRVAELTGGNAILFGILSSDPVSGLSFFIPESTYDLSQIGEITGTSDAAETQVIAQPYTDFGFETALDAASFPGNGFDNIRYVTSGPISGEGGDDILFSLAGGQVLPGSGADVVVTTGGVGQVNYLASTAAVVVDLLTGTGSGGAANGDRYYGVRDVIGSAFGDTINGDDNAALFGGNFLIGQGGDDFIEGGAGADYIDGGDGFDWITFDRSTSGVEVSLFGTGAASGTGGHAQGDTYENVENISGSAFDDLLSGNSGFSHILGNDGDDTIFATTGNDIYDGGNGEDTLNAGNGGFLAGVIFNLSTDTAGGDAAGMSITGFEHLVGTNLYDDTLTGTNGANTIDGRDGNDQIYGLGGNDTLIGGVGNDLIVGGAGIDLFLGDAGDDNLIVNCGEDVGGSESYSGGTGQDRLILQGGGGNLTHDLRPHSVLNLERLKLQAVSQGGERLAIISADTFIANGLSPTGFIEGSDVAGSTEALRIVMDTATTRDFRALTFLDWGGQDEWVEIIGDGDDEVITGPGVSAELRGNGGDDVLTGGAGNDTLLGGSGDDLLEGGAGNDNFDGGSNDAGGDTVSYAEATGGVEVYLLYPERDVGGGQGFDELVNIENLIGSAFDDRLVGDGGNNVLTGGSGDDIIKGKGGNDTYYGGFGADNIRGGDGVDVIFGDNDDDVLFGLRGDDTLEGGIGRDFLYGGRDQDILRGGTGDDELRGNIGNDTLFGDAGVDDLRGGGNDDMLDGGSQDDFLSGENGSDVLDGGVGDDSLTGGFGAGVLDGLTDVFVYSVGSAGGGFDRIKDFEDGIDVIDLTAFGFAGFANVAALASTAGTGVRIDFGSGNVLFVENFALSSLDASDVFI